MEQRNTGLLRRHRLQQTHGTKDFHNPLHVVGEHIEAHFCAESNELTRQEMRRAHPLFERPEVMLNSPFSDSHHVWCMVHSTLHFFKHGFVFPATDPPLLTRRALRLQRATLAFKTPVTVQ